MKTSTHTVSVPVSEFVSPFVRGEWDSNVPNGTPMPCVVYSGSVTITGTCFLVCDEDGQYWECDQSTLSWILDGAGIEMGNATYPYKGAFPLVVCGWDVEMNPSVHSIVAGSPADVELRKLLSRLEESHMLAHIEDAAASNPKYLAFVVERAEAKQRVAAAR